MFINRWMNKGNTVWPYNGILRSFKKEGNSAICNNMNEPSSYYANEISNHRKTNTAWFYLHEVSNTDKFIESKSGVIVAKGFEEGWTRRY